MKYKKKSLYINYLKKNDFNKINLTTVWILQDIFRNQINRTILDIILNSRILMRVKEWKIKILILIFKCQIFLVHLIYLTIINRKFRIFNKDIKNLKKKW
jgi:hypothetical protein